LSKKEKVAKVSKKKPVKKCKKLSKCEDLEEEKVVPTIANMSDAAESITQH
jgi:hypothetical protein